MAEALDILPEGAVIEPSPLDELPEGAVIQEGPLTSPLEAPEPETSPFDAPDAGPALVLESPRIIPEVVTKAANAGIVYDKPAPTGHFLGSLSIDGERRISAYKKALSDKFNRDIEVRRGKETGQIEWLDPGANRWTLVQPPGSGMETIEGMAGPAMTIGTEAFTGIATAIFTRSPALTKFAGSAGAFAGEIMRLSLGRSLGTNEDVTDNEIILEAAKEAGIALVAGEAGDRLLRVGKFFIDAAKGRVLPKSTLDAMESGTGGKEGERLFETVEEAQETARRVNERIGSAKLRFSLAQQTNDEDLLVYQDIFRRSPQFRQEFGRFETEQTESLREFYETINRPYRARSSAAAPGEMRDASTAETGERVRDIAQARVERGQQRQDIFVKTKEADLERAITSIKERPYEDLGRPLRDFTSEEQLGFKEWADGAAKNLHNLAGGKEFIPNNRTHQVVRDLDESIRRALFSSVQQPQRRLIGQEVVGEEEVPEAVQLLRESMGVEAESTEPILNKVFDPSARFTFEEAWDAISALKRVERVSSKGLSTDEPEVAAVRRLYQALEGDLRSGAQNSSLRDQYDQFIRRYATQKRRLDEGAVGDIMRRRSGKNSPFVVNDEQVFRKFFTPGTDREAKELRSLIENSPEQMQGMRQAVGDFYKRAVGVTEDGRVNLNKHKQFMRAFERPMRVFFNSEEMRLFAKPGQLEQALRAREQARERALKEINKSFEGELSSLNNPGRIVSLIMDPKNPDKARQVVDVLEQEGAADVLRGVRAEFRKDMSERIAGAFQGGDRILSAANFQRFIEGKGGDGGFREVARSLFGDQYVNDLDTLNTALKIASRETQFPNRSNTAFWTDTVKNLSRAYVGLFTRPGRMITALDKIRGRTANRVLMDAMVNPESARELLELKGVDMRTRKAISVISQMGGSALLQDFE